MIGEAIKGEENNFPVNPHWPQNYIDEIVKNWNEEKYKIVFILARDYILEKLNTLNINYLVAVPEDGLKQEYISRAISRGNNENFVDIFGTMYDEWRNMMILQPVTKIYLEKGEYIEDSLKRLKLYYSKE